MLAHQLLSPPETLGLLDKSIETTIKQNADITLASILLYHFRSGGKKIRAKLAIECMLLMGQTLENALTWGLCCELLHNATLIHDDLQDEDQMRRGQPTVWARYGKHAAITAGDFLIALPFKIIAQSHFTLQQKFILQQDLAQTSLNLANGQQKESFLKFCGANEIWNHYQECVKLKTGALFELPVLGALHLLQFDFTWVESIEKSCQNLGLIFQILDDYIDLFGNKGRGEIGSDIKEGKISALIAFHIHNFPEFKNELLGYLNLPRSKTNHLHIEKIQSMLLEKATPLKLIQVINKLIGELDRTKCQHENCPILPFLIRLTKEYSHSMEITL